MNTFGWSLLTKKFDSIDANEIMKKLMFYDRDYFKTIMALEGEM